MLVVERERGRDAAQVGSSSAKPRLLRALSPTSPPLHLLIFPFSLSQYAARKGGLRFFGCVSSTAIFCHRVCVSSCL